MRRVALVLLFASVAATAQQPIPNGGFESWQLFEGSGAFKDYEEPMDGWSSGNGAIHVAPNTDPVCERSEDAHTGMYAAKLTTRRIFGQIASGSMFTGRFELNLGNPRESARLGMPYTDKPLRFTGYYKYLPAGGDSAVIRATFRRWTGTEREIVAEALLKVYGTVDVWTPFELNVSDFTADPDTVEVVFAASAGGEFFSGDVGSTLFIDDVAFDNISSVSLERRDSREVVGQWLSEAATMRFDQNVIGASYTVVDYCGNVLVRGTATREVDLQILPTGVFGIRCAGHTMMFIR